MIDEDMMMNRTDITDVPVEELMKRFAERADPTDILGVLELEDSEDLVEALKTYCSFYKDRIVEFLETN